MTRRYKTQRLCGQFERLNTVANAVLAAAKIAQPAAAGPEADAQDVADATKTNVRISALDVTSLPHNHLTCARARRACFDCHSRGR